MSADPSYPLLPVASILCSVLLLLVLATNFLRRSSNFGVAALCFGLLLEALTTGINSILWADNANIKAEVYCDIVSHIQVFVFILRPACSLVITRRLHHIALMHAGGTVQHVEHLHHYVDVFLVFVLPAVVTGLFYVIQVARFQVIEGFGCGCAYNPDGVAIILYLSWPVILPLISVLIYIPKILWTFYRLKQETGPFLIINNSMSANFYFRILLIGCMDVIFTLPLGIATVIISIKLGSLDGDLPFYWGWTYNHTLYDWAPLSVPYAVLQQSNIWNVVEHYLSRWAAIVLGYIIFALFGCTVEARTVYLTWFYRAMGRSPPATVPELSGIVFGIQDTHIDSNTDQSSQRGAASKASLEEENTWEDKFRITEHRFDQGWKSKIGSTTPLTQSQLCTDV